MVVATQKFAGKLGQNAQRLVYPFRRFFQIEIKNPEEALKKAFEIKALIKKVEPLNENKKISTIDVRMAIGVGEKNYTAESIAESNGSAFIYSSEKFELLKKKTAQWV